MDSSGDTSLDEIKHGDLIPIINALPEQKTPIQALSQKVEEFFHCGPDAAFAAFQNLQAAITRSSYKLKDSRIEVPVTSDLGFLSRIFSSNLNATTFWETPTMASTLVLLFACPSNVRTIHDVVTDQGRTFGGTPAIESTRTTPSMSLQEAYQQAKSTAQGGQSTAMVVTLHDVFSLDVDEGQDMGYYSNFSHFFTIGVGPEGVRIWQAGGHNGYGFDQYLRDGHARLRTWDEAEKFASDFDTLASQEVSIETQMIDGSDLVNEVQGKWTAHINKLYESLFLIDIDKICGEDGPQPPVTPEFKAWVRIRTFENVTYEDITKFVWIQG